jgi:hypothetical protein
VTLSSGLVMTAAATGQHAPLNGHLWHTIEALGFLITSLGGIAVAEFVQARHRHSSSGNVLAAPGATLTVGRASAGALLPARTDVDRALGSVPTAAPARRRSTLLPLVALAGSAAAAVHFVVMPEHFQEATLYGAFFAVAASAQLVYSMLLLARPSRTLLAAGVVGNITIVLLWLVTRTIGIPLGPAAGTTEGFGGLDVLATIFELTTAIGAIALLRRPWPLERANRPSTWSPLIWALGPGVAIAIAVVAYVAPPS